MSIDNHSTSEQFRLACQDGHRALRQKIDGDGWVCRTCDGDPSYVVDLRTETVVWRSEYPDPHSYRVPSVREVREMVRAAPLTRQEIADEWGVGRQKVEALFRSTKSLSDDDLRGLLDVLREGMPK